MEAVLQTHLDAKKGKRRNHGERHINGEKQDNRLQMVPRRNDRVGRRRRVVFVATQRLFRKQGEQLDARFHFLAGGAS